MQAAIRKDGVVYTLEKPARHPAVMELGGMHKSGRIERWKLADGEQGFLTDRGVFLSRESAAKHAVECGQIKPTSSSSRRDVGYLNHPPNLYTEDLW